MIALNHDNVEHYLLTPKPVLRPTPTLFEPKQVQSAISPTTFTEQESGIYSNAELLHFSNRVLFKHSDTTLKFLRKAKSFDSLATSEKHSTDFYSNTDRVRFNHYDVLRVGLHDHLLNIAPLFAPEGFANAFTALFGLPCYILTQCGSYFSTFLFIQYVITFLLKIYKSISIKYKLRENIAKLSSIVYRFLNDKTSKKVTDLHEAECEKRQLKGAERFGDPPGYY